MKKIFHVFKIREMKSVDRGPGLRGWPLLTGEKGSEHLTTGITEFQPGAQKRETSGAGGMPGNPSIE